MPCAADIRDDAAMSDDGFTSLPGGPRLRKSDPLICALGGLDELNAALGLLRAALAGLPDAALIETVQRDLLHIGSELATGRPRLEAAALARLEAEIARRKTGQAPPAGFVLPGADERSARAHWARAVCRRAEREFVRAQETYPDRASALALAYLNRLSYLLFATAQQD